ncbi:MAG: serine protease [Tepidisphaeraceae bacterium]
MKKSRSFWSLFASVTVVAFGAMATIAVAEPDEIDGPSATQPADAASRPTSASVVPFDAQSINAGQLYARSVAQARRMARDGQLTPSTQLPMPEDGKPAALTLEPLGGAPMHPSDIYKTRSRGVVIVFGVNPALPRTSTTTPSETPTSQPSEGGPTTTSRPTTAPVERSRGVESATGFIISKSGAMVTNYHVVANKDNAGFVAVTRDGKLLPVKAILAASASLDLAIVQLEGEGFEPMPIAERIDVGENVFCLSHPAQRFWYFTRGMVASYGVTARRGGQPVDRMMITADYAKGSSGGPILNENGDVVGVVSTTASVYYTETPTGGQQNLQMVFKSCVTSKQLLSLVETPAAGAK